MDTLMRPDTLDGPRVESYWVERLDRADRRISLITTVKGGSVEQNWDAPIKGGASITLHQPDIDVMKDRIRPWVRVNDLSWPLGVYLPSSPSESYDDDGLTWTFECLDKLSILDDDKITTAWGYDTGTVVTEAVLDVILGSGETSVALTESTATLRTPLSWKAGTSKLAIVNELLGAIGFSPLWVDGFGQYRVEPVIRADKKPVRRVFAQGEYAIHQQRWTRERKISHIPNRVICRTDGTDEIDGLEAVAQNTEPDSEFSYEARGYRWVTQVYDEDESVDQATLEELAERRLWGWTHPPSHYRVSHAVVPYDLLDVVRFVSDGHDVLAQVNEYQVPLEVGGQMSALWYGMGGA